MPGSQPPGRDGFSDWLVPESAFVDAVFIHPRQMADLREMARVEDARAQTRQAHARQRERRRAERRARWEVLDAE